MGTSGSPRPDAIADPAPRTAAEGQSGSLHALISRAESIAPYAAGGMLLCSGVCAAGHSLGLQLPAGPLGGASLATSLLVAGSGAGILIGTIENWRLRQQLDRARQEVLRANAQRDVAMMQARRMRAQAEGLALMREIHRSTSIPVRHERLHRILTLLADLFEAREVALFAATGDTQSQVQPAACIRITNKEELFIAFDTEELARISGENTGARLQGSRAAQISVTKNSATIVREGCHLYVEGILERNGVPVAKAQWRRGANAEHDALSQYDTAEILDVALAKIDYGPAACALASQALERRRTVRMDDLRGPGQSGSHDGLVLCVPLLADQKPIGALRIRRSIEGFSGPEAEALEELLLESAKHIALALKKDEDDRKAITDALTSLYIKRHFLVKLEQLRAESASSGKGFCLILIDIDHFKKVNDTHGHLSGDMVLKGVAGILRKGLRTGDMAFRYGGEEMALLLPEATIESAEQTADRMRAAVQAAVLKGENGQHVPVTISLGIVQHQTGLTGETLISRADRALYFSKQNGRNRATRWTPQLKDTLVAQVNGKH